MVTALGLSAVPSTVGGDTPASDLLRHVTLLFDRNRKHKESAGVVAQIETNLRDYLATYDPATLEKINQAGQTPVFVPLIATKCNAAYAWLTDVFTNEQDRTWSIRPTPSPELPKAQQAEVFRKISAGIQEGNVAPEQVPQVMEALEEEARAQAFKLSVDAASRREALLHDQLTQGGFREAFHTFLWDLVVSKTGILKGPVLKFVPTKHWAAAGEVSISYEPRPTFSAVSPSDAFPSPDDVDFSGDFVERMKLLRRDLDELRDLPGYDAKAIEELLAAGPAGTAQLENLEGDQERANLEDKPLPGVGADDGPPNADDRITVFNTWCRVQGKLLDGTDVKTDLAGEDVEDDKYYDVEVLHTDTKVLYVGLNSDPLGRKPYTKQGWCKRPGSFWFDGLPERLHDVQRICNAAVRSLVANMGSASGFQVVLTDVDRVPEGEDITTSFPQKVWQFTNKRNSNSPPLDFKQPASNAAELNGVFENFSKLADDYSGVPAYWYGNDAVAGAGRTMGGLSMLMSNSAKGIKRVVLAIDQDVFRKLIELLYDWNLLYNGEAFGAAGGDIEVVPMGAVALMAKEAMSERRMSFLQATANEQDMKVMGMRGRAAVLREAAKTLEMQGETIVLPDDQLQALEEQERQAAGAQQQAEAQAAQAEAQARQQEGQLRVQEAQVQLQIKQMELQIKQAELELKAQDQQTKAQERAVELERKQRETDADIQLRGAELQTDAALREREIGVKEMDSVAKAEAEAANNAQSQREAQGSGSPAEAGSK
jgi:hypothetical protein